jgi:RNA polymerase sigma-70 factor (ECF subfamily)
LHPDLELFRSEASAFVDRFLGELEPDKRIVFILSDLEELTMREISAALGVNQNTASSRLRSARQAFARAAVEFDVPAPPGRGVKP